ncbi:MAG: transporter substrate-binding domain-containing protein [Legionellaceae bacterium]|nr:transporter substrate-binding domain-containing protein [Legionellaceae bacterium]
MRFSILVILVVINNLSFAAPQSLSEEIDNTKVLNVAVSNFSPPFIIRSGKSGFMGFDINLMNYICSHLKRKCVYHPMTFDNLISSVASGKMDVAASAIIITFNRLSKVSMSQPYLVSASRFLGPAVMKNETLNRKLLENKKIGVESGSVWLEQLKSLNIGSLKIVPYSQENFEIDALSKKNVDMVLMDDLMSQYWSQNSYNKFSVVGGPIKYGFGYGVVVNPNDKQLLDDINDALDLYLKSDEYSQNYQMYISKFH